MTPPLRPLPTIPDSLKGTRQAMSLMLASQVGYREGYDNDTEFGVWYQMNHEPWCGEFISWGADEAYIPTSVIPKYAYTPAGQQWFASRGRLHDDPQVGDIGFVYYSSIGRVGHTFYVDSIVMNNGRPLVHTIEGNTNDTGSSQGLGVYRLIRADTDFITYGRPDYAVSLPSGESGDAIEVPPPAQPPVQEDDMPRFIADAGRGGPAYLLAPLTCRPIGPTEYKGHVDSGVPSKIWFLPTAEFDAVKAGVGLDVKNVAGNVDTALADDFDALAAELPDAKTLPST